MRIPLLSWLFSIPFCYFLLIHIVVVSGQCDSNQQQSLLLQLKNSLTYNSTLSTKLVRWSNASNYCSWDGVFCQQGCVTQLDLSNEFISGGLDNSSALFSLQYIEQLNLAFNNFNYGLIPSEFNKLASLIYLNLSNAGFAGQIPIEISQLTRLEFLDLSTISFPGVPALQLENPNLNKLIGNLSEIVELHLDGVNISAPGAQWCRAISSSLPNLRVLSLSNCNLLGPIDDSLQNLRSLSEVRIDSNNLSTQVPKFLSNFTNLTSLHIMTSGLYGTFPKEIFQVRTLQVIDLIGNPDLQGSLPDFPKDGALQSLFLAMTNFSGSLPESIGNLKMLSRLDLSYCNFTGSIPKSMASLTELVYVDMSKNKFSGSVPDLSMAKNLTDINLSYNNLTGQINSTLWEGLTSLMNLNLHDNKLSGSIPSSLVSLPLLQKLQLLNNQFSSQLPEFGNMPLLDTLDLSSNNLEGIIPESIFKLQGLKILTLNSNNFSGSFSLNSIQQFKNLSRLDLSHNSLSISYNNSTNSSQSSLPNITTLNLASGKLRTFPDFLRHQSKLTNLDLSQNQIDGEIPNWIWSLSTLAQLNLSCNSLVTLEGPFINLTSTLSILDLHSNQLQGPISILPPHAIYLDYSGNNFSSSIPDHIGDFLNYTMFLSFSSNNLNGSIPKSMCNSAYLQVLDLSNNSLSGSIPECLSATGNKTLVVLNLRRNSLVGTIPDTFSFNCTLQTLDLNGNQLKGQFPKSLGNCTLLEVLNLGNNQIRDKYPCLLKNISTLRVLVLRSNRFHECLECPNTNGTWPKLQIVDIAHNNFSGNIPGHHLTTWEAMMGNEDEIQSKSNHLQFKVLQFSDLYYQDAITVTTKGLELELVKILTVFTSIDISCNNFSGSIPPQVGLLKALYALNISNNALTGPIPASLGNLTQLESLDLSNNRLSGTIPQELADLNFLSFLNVSDNQLSGRIPSGNQFQTFLPQSFEDNEGLCGVPLIVKCSAPPDEPSTGKNKTGLDWESIYTGLGYGVGAGVIVILLMVWEEGRNWMDDSTDRILLVILPMMGYSYKIHHEWDCDDDNEDEDDYEQESLFFVQGFDQEEFESEEKGFQGRFCVYCSKLDISRKTPIHDPNCTCHLSRPMASTSSCSSSFSP